MRDSSDDVQIVGLLMAAGALAAGGVAGASHLMDRATRKRNQQRYIDSRKATSQALEVELELAEIRAVAAARGIDPEGVEREIRSLSSNSANFDHLQMLITSVKEKWA